MILELTTKTLDAMTFANALKLQAKDRAQIAADRAAKGLPPKEYKASNRVDINDSTVEGLMIRVTRRKDRMAWSLLYTSPDTGKQKRESLGVYGKAENGAVSLAMAHDKARALKEGINNKVDPQSARLAKGPVVTFGEAMEMRLAVQVFGMAKGAEATAKRYRTKFADLLKLDITKFAVNPHWNKLVETHEAKKQLRATKQVRSDLNCIFDFAVSKGFVAVNPIPQEEKVKCGGGVVERRAHALSPDRFKALWLKLPEVMSRKKEIAIKLAMVTGQRIGEITKLNDADITERSATDWVWTMPGNVRNAQKVLIKAGITKNGHFHAVPLSALAIRLIKELRALADSPALFSTKGKKLTANNISSAIWTAQKTDAFGIGDWTVHMVRHTVITGMTELGVAKADISKVVNHTLVQTAEEKTGSGWGSLVTKGYTHQTDIIAARELKAKRDALDLWAEFVAELVGETPKLKLVA